MSSPSPRIGVVGSINMDLLIRCGTLPSPGETIVAESVQEACGGKGANQAVAASRLGAHVAIVGRVGDDAFAATLLQNLSKETVNTDHVQISPETSSGLAVVAVEQSGQNSIVLVPGANAALTVADVEASAPLIASCDALLLQLEVPLPVVAAAIEIARSHDVPTILDPAPAPGDWPSGLSGVDLLCPNESEAAAILGQPVNTLDEARQAARQLQQDFAEAVVVTLGERGVVLCEAGETEWIKSFPVAAVDTTGAGDTFAGALAVFLAAGQQLKDAARLANAAAAISVLQPGAQTGMPAHTDIETFLRSQ